MSRVFLATDLSLDRQVVIKVLAPELAAGVSAERFRREIQMVAKLQHPHIVSILSAGDAEGALYYVMPFMSGESLRGRLVREGQMSVRDTVRVLREMLDALSFAHANGVVHRDIKPENILSGAGHAVVADFGVSKALQDSGAQTTAGIALGTPAYMAPEQIAADPNTDQRADLYAAALVAYEMLAGAPPFSGTPGQLLKAHLSDVPTPIAERRADVPSELAALIMRALEKEPDHRPQNAEEMIAVLDGVLTTGATSSGGSPPNSGRTVSSGNAAATGSRRSPAMTAAALAFIAITGAGGYWFLRDRPVVEESAQSIAVAPFAVADGDTALVRLGQNLVTTISANITVGEIRTADPMAMLSQAKQLGSTLTQADAAKLARKLGARSVLYGTLTREGGLVRVVATLRDIDNPNSVIADVDFKQSSDSISVLTDSLTWKVLRKIWQKGKAPTPNATSIFTKSPRALGEFLNGEQFFARGGIDEATAAYERAIAEDTTFWFAHYRYKVARDWLGYPMDTTITHRLARHLRDLPPRERQFMLARDSSNTLNERLSNLKAVVERYPDYTPALLGYADLLAHHAMRAGHNASEAIAPWKRLAELVPSDMEATSHVTWLCMATGDLECAQQSATRFDSLVRVDSALLIAREQNEMLKFALRPRTPTLMDSLNRDVQNSVFPYFASAFSTTMLGDVIAQDPQFWTVNDKMHGLYESRLTGAKRDSVRLVRLMLAATRGSVASIDTALAEIRRYPALQQSFVRMRVLNELQGLLTPEASIAAAALEGANAPGTPVQIANDFRWMAAANALLRGDSAAYKARLVEFARDPSRHSRNAVRSLRGIALWRSGKQAAAAESLVVLERFHADSLGLVWGAFGADRLLAADWLTREKKYAAADSLLYFTEGYTITSLNEVSTSIYGAALLQRSRIAEGRGDSAAAIRYASIFLGVYDKPSPSAKLLVDEARDRLKRLRTSDAARRP